MKFNKGDLVYILCQGIWYGSEGVVEGRREDGAYVVAIDYDTPEPKQETFAEEHLRMLNPAHSCFDCQNVNRPGYMEPCASCTDKNHWKSIEIGAEDVPQCPAETESGEFMCAYQKPCVYRKAIDGLFDKQFQKGVEKYGVTLEENDTLTTEQRIEHLEEELADGMVYCEHLKAAVGGDNLTADDYQRAALRTARTDEFDKDKLLLNGVMGLCGESGEVIDLLKKSVFQGHEFDKEEMILELGDCLWYSSLIAHALGCRLSEVMEKNIGKLKKRFPDGFDKARSINRKENKTEEKTPNLFDGD